MNTYKKIFLFSVLNLISTFTLACALGGPSYALPLNSSYADVHYTHVGKDLKHYLVKSYNIHQWKFVDENTIKILAPDYAEYQARIGLELPTLCKTDYQCTNVSLFLLSSLPVIVKFNGIKNIPDPVSGLTAIINDVETKNTQGYVHIAHYNLSPSTLEIRNRVNFTERENILYVLLQAQDKTGQVVNFITGKRIVTPINTCSARYWSLDDASGAHFNNKQWQEWNNYYYRDYDGYLDSLGEWMHPYRLANPVIYKDPPQ